MKGLSIIIPVYNEEKSIALTLEEILSIMEKSNIEYEIIVVNDGSSDKTGEILDKYKNERIKVVNQDKNCGYGASIKTGIRFAKFDKIAITDADSTYPNDRLPELYNTCSDYDMVVGARSFKNLPSKTKPAKWLIIKLANYITKTKIPDINSGLRVFRKESFMPFLPIIPDGFSLTTTITLGMLSGGYRVKFISIDYFAREGKSKIKPFKDTSGFLKLIFKMGLYFAPLKIFMPISIFFFLLGIAWGLFSWLYLGIFADTSTIIIILASLQVALLALLAELINHRMPNNYIKMKDEDE